MKIILNPQPAISVNHPKPIRGCAKLIAKRQISKLVYELIFEMLDPLEINFKAGQYIAIEIEKTIRRQYSISSAPQSKKQFQMIIDIKPNGVGVNYLMNLKIEDSIKFVGQIGLFVMPDKLDKNLFFISTGTGIAPLKSMIEDLINQERFKNHNINVIFGTRFAEDIFYKEVFEKYLQEQKIANYQIYLSQSDKEYAGIEKGYVTEYFKDYNSSDLENSQFFICGGMNMIKSVEELLISKGVQPDKIIYEKFY